MMTKEQLAAMLNGRKEGSEIDRDEEKQAKDDGLLVVFGYSDDNIEFRGAFSDEAGCYDGGDIRITAEGVLESWEHLDKDDKEGVRAWFEKDKVAKTITAIWDHAGYSWFYATDIPHATFDILSDDGSKYCRGIVLAVADLSKP